MSDDFVAAINAFGHRMASIQCMPNKKKKRGNRSNSSIIRGDLPKFILRFSSKENCLCIELLNLLNLYQVILTEQDLADHLSNSGLKNCAFNRYFSILNATFFDPEQNIKLTKGKGGGYMILTVQYPIENDIVTNGTFELCLIDEYCQNEDDLSVPSDYKQKMVMEMFETALSHSNNNDNRNNNNNDKKEADDDDDDDVDLKDNDNNLALQRKIKLLQQENTRLRLMVTKQNIGADSLSIGNGFDGMSLTQDLSATLSAKTNIKNTRIRKQRDPNRSLMNPRRAKRRKVGFNFAGSKNKNK